MDSRQPGAVSRRDYLKSSAAGLAGIVAAPGLMATPAIAAPLYVPAHVIRGRRIPSRTINLGAIGFGRISRTHDLPEILKEENVRLVAVADVDMTRASEADQWAQQFYAGPRINRPSGVDRIAVYQDFREMLAEHPEIDAVVVSTPDHAHVLPVLAAALAGKAVYMQKPHALTVAEGRLMSDVLTRMGTIFSVGSQQRSTSPWPQFKRAVEAVRNGRVGNLHTIQVGLPGDPPGGDPTPQPVPPGLDYDKWLGTTPYVPYTEDRVHPQNSRTGRGGWLRCEQFSAGMITGWGAHHIDIAHWGMNTEHTGPIQLEAEAAFASGGLWDVHGDFRVEAKYANGVTMVVSGAFPNGIRFEGDEGWIFVTRDGGVTPSDPTSNAPVAGGALQASSALLLSDLGPDALRLYGEENTEHHTAWIRCIQNETPRTAAPAEVSHRSTSACLLAHIAMKLPGVLRWDPVNERFADNARANSMLSRPQRSPYTVSEIPGLLADRWERSVG